MNERDTECPLGLLPGATAIFHSLERKIAKAGNVYCRMLAFSSVNILGFETHRCSESVISLSGCCLFMAIEI